MTAAQSSISAVPVRRRRPGRWLRPRGMVRGRPTLEYNRVYDSVLPAQWLPEGADIRQRAGRSAPLAAGAIIGEPARWWLRHRYRVIAADCAIVVLAVLIGIVPLTAGGWWTTPLGIEPGEVGPGSAPSEPALWALVIAAGWLALLTLGELWSVGALRSGQATTRPLVRSALILFLGVGLLAFVRGDQLPRAFLLVSIPLGLLGLIVARAVARRHVRAMRTSGALPGLVLLDGPESDVGRRLAAELPECWGAATTVCVENAGASTDAAGRSDGSTDHLRHRIRTAGADLLVLAEPERYTPGQIAELAWDALALGTDLMVPAPSTGGRIVRPAPVAARLVGGVSVRSGVPDLGLIAVDPRRPRSERGARVVVDGVLAAAAAVLLLPVVLVAMIVAAIAQGPPVFIENERLGRDGRVYRVWAFRCVVGTPGASRDDRRGTDPTSTGLTPVGRVLRRSGLENVPALLSVLSTDLALIGPRPLVPAVGVRSAVTPWLRPGLTGRWRDPSREDTSEVDGEHLWRDLRVLVRLVGRRLRGRLADD